MYVIQTENWLSVADGYARQRGIKGWPIGAGWPKESDTAEKTAGQLDEAQAATAAEADDKVEEAKAEQKDHLDELAKQNNKESKDQQEKRNQGDPGDLGYCTVWVGTTQEREHTDTSTAPPSKAVAEDWQLMEPDAGITVVYFPFLSNPEVENVDPVTAPYMSTWNFIYTPEDIDNVVRLARANFEEGRERTRRTIRAVYERKKKLREEREGAERDERFRRKMRLGIIGKNGAHFS
jgi:phospholipase A2